MTSTKTRRWLLGNDGSAAAMQAAHYVARWWRTFAVSKVEVITAVADNDRLRPPTAVEAEERPHHIRSEDTERVAAVLQRAGVDVQCSITAGAPADVLLREADLRNVSEILVGFRGNTQSTVLTLGSVAYKVVHHSVRPVTVVSDVEQRGAAAPTVAQAAQRVLLAVDGSEHSLEAVRYLREMAERTTAIDAILVNVQIPIGSAYIRRFVSRAMIETYHQEEGTEALRAATNALSEAGISFESQIHVAHITETIAPLGEQLRCDRIVMGARGMGALAGLVLGSTAYRVLHTARVPITFVRSNAASAESA